jgi:hypothetical protein
MCTCFLCAFIYGQTDTESGTYIYTQKEKTDRHTRTDTVRQPLDGYIFVFEMVGLDIVNRLECGI